MENNYIKFGIIGTKPENKLATKEELIDLLKKHRGILTNSILDYLNSLVELEFSVVRKNISTEEREILSELEIYKKIATYNIYHRALQLLEQQKQPIDIDNNGSLIVSMQLENRRVKLFSFDYQNRISLRENIPDEYKSMKIGTVSLYRSLQNEDLREKEINRVLRKLESLHASHNPYPTRRGVVGGPDVYWERQHKERVEELEKKLTELESKKELTEVDKKEIELTNDTYQLLLADYELTNEDFEERKMPKFTTSEFDRMNKTRIKRMPNLTITDQIRYL
jgi:hypothetical protein